MKFLLQRRPKQLCRLASPETRHALHRLQLRPPLGTPQCNPAPLALLLRAPKDLPKFGMVHQEKAPLLQIHQRVTHQPQKTQRNHFFTPQKSSGLENLESLGFLVQENITGENTNQMTCMELENLNYIHLIFNTIFSIRMGVFR